MEDAVRRGDAERVRALLARGEDPDARDGHGQTAVMIAAREGHVGVLRALIAHGAALDHTAKYGLSALMIAAVNGRDEAARLLVEAGADTGLRGTGAPGFAGRTALDLAEDRGLDALAALLREAR